MVIMRWGFHMGSWRPPSINPYISLAHPITFPPNKPLVLKFLSQSRLLEVATPDTGSKSEAPSCGSASASLIRLWPLHRACLDTACPALGALGPLSPVGLIPPRKLTWADKIPPESRRRCQHLRPEDPKSILNPFLLPSCSQLWSLV